MGIKPLTYTFLACCILLSCSSTARFRADDLNKKSGGTGLERIQYGVASYYGKKFHGRLTANGEVFDMYQVSAAHQFLPLGTIVKVTNLDNGKSLVIRINDRGPFVKNRILDCSYAAAEKLGFIENGTANIKIVVVNMGKGKK